MIRDFFRADKIISEFDRQAQLKGSYENAAVKIVLDQRPASECKTLARDGSLDGHMLSDIVVSYEDIWLEINKPLWRK